MTRPPQRSTLFPYTTLFRSDPLDGSVVHNMDRRSATNPLAILFNLDTHEEMPVAALCNGILRDALDRGHERLNFVREADRSEEHTSELQSPCNLVCRLLLEK